MSYEINAWLEQGKPQLQIIDADSGSVRLAWRASGHSTADPAVKELFRELFLLSALQDLDKTGKKNPRR